MTAHSPLPHLAANAVLNVYCFLTCRISSREMAEMAFLHRQQLESVDWRRTNAAMDSLYDPLRTLLIAAGRFHGAELAGDFTEAYIIRQALHALSDWIEAIAKRQGRPIVICNGELLQVVQGDAA